METGLGLFSTAYTVQDISSHISYGFSYFAAGGLVTRYCLLRGPSWCDVLSLALRRVMKPFLHPEQAKGEIYAGTRTWRCHWSGVLPRRRLGAVTQSIGCRIPAVT